MGAEGCFVCGLRRQRLGTRAQVSASVVVGVCGAGAGTLRGGAGTLRGVAGGAGGAVAEGATTGGVAVGVTGTDGVGTGEAVAAGSGAGDVSIGGAVTGDAVIGVAATVGSVTGGAATGGSRFKRISDSVSSVWTSLGESGASDEAGEGFASALRMSLTPAAIRSVEEAMGRERCCGNQERVSAMRSLRVYQTQVL
jgi:hypothetical protein